MIPARIIGIPLKEVGPKPRKLESGKKSGELKHGS